MSELKPCPFCGEVPTWDKNMAATLCDCYAYYDLLDPKFTKWNNRPIEDALQARIDELEHKNEVLMDSYLESETINDKGELVGSLEHFRQRIAELEKQLQSYKDFCSAIEREE